jgi:hypothetical protein
MGIQLLIRGCGGVTEDVVAKWAYNYSYGDVVA